MTDRSGVQQNQYQYDAFGVTYTLQSNLITPYRFVGTKGYFTDTNSGMDLLGRRYYLPALGRFLTQDPLGHEAGLNLYAYVNDNPKTHVDTTGLFDEIPVKQIAPDKIGFKPPYRGASPLDHEGRPIELHHVGRDPSGPIEEMTWQEHRGRGNHGRNHPNRSSDVEHGQKWKEFRQKHWQEQWDNGRFDAYPDLKDALPSGSTWDYVNWKDVGVKAGAVLGLGGLVIISVADPATIPATTAAGAKLIPLLAR